MPTSFYAVKNNVGSTVAAPYTAGSGSLTLADASAFPTVYPYRLSLFYPNGSPKSILSVSGRTGNVLTIGGAIEGTTDVSLSVGDLARLRVTAGALQDVHAAVNAVETTIGGYGDIVTHATAEFATASNLTAHTSNTSNPHAVTAAQVGSYTTAQVDTLLSGKQAAGSYVPTTTTVAGHALASNVTITPADIGAQAAGTYVTGTLVTTLGTPGSNTNVPSEAAVRSAISSAGGGTVSSVGLTMPSGFSVANSPVTSTGTLAVTTALSGYVKASGGAFTAGSIATGDIPDISSTYATVASLAGYVPTTRTVAGHALSSNVTIATADISNLATWTGSTAITTLGTVGTGTWQGAVIGPAYLGTGTRDGTKYLRDDGAWTAVSGGSAYDLLSPLTSAEISITGATTATISRMHVCSGTSANYTVTLPSITGNSGKLIGFRMANSLTKLVTLDAGSGVTIDGQQTRVLWQGESAFLLCNGTGWAKIAGKTIAMSAAMRCADHSNPGQAQNINRITQTKVALNTVDSDPTGAMADAGNNGVKIVRPGSYIVVNGALFASSGTGSTVFAAYIFKNATNVIYNAVGPSGTPFPMITYTLGGLVAGDYVYLYCWQDATGSLYLYGDTTGGASICVVTEVPAW